MGRSDRRFCIRWSQVSHLRQALAGGRVGHVKARRAGQPLAVDEGVGLQQGRVLQGVKW